MARIRRIRRRGRGRGFAGGDRTRCATASATQGHDRDGDRGRPVAGHVQRWCRFRCDETNCRTAGRRDADRAAVVIAVDSQSVSVMAEMRSEEHTSELQSLMRISYAVFCLKKKKQSSY